MKKIKDLFNNISLKKKLFILYFLGIILYTGVFGSIYATRINNLTIQGAKQFANISINQTGRSISAKLGMMADIIGTLINSSVFGDYIYSDQEGPYDAIETYTDTIQPIIEGLYYKDPTIKVRLYNSNEDIKISRITNNTLEDFTNLTGMNIDEIENKGISWKSGIKFINYDDEKYLCCFRPFYDYVADSATISMILAVFMPERKIEALYEDELDEGYHIFLYDGGKIIMCSEEEYLYRDIGGISFLKGESMQAMQSDTIIRYKGKKYIFIKNAQEESGEPGSDWGLAALVPAEYLINETREIWVSNILLSFVCALLASGLLIIFINDVTKRINKLVQHTRNVHDGKFDTAAKITKNDEIGILEKNFNEMTHKINKLINEVYVANIKAKDIEIKNQEIELEKRQAQIIALQGQINPHYLFNTLESIRMNLVIKGDMESATIIKMFGESFRVVMNEKSDMLKLEDELKFVENYFNIQKFRYGDKIHFEIIDMEPYAKCLIPKLTLQPIVENAIYHGIEMKQGKGRVTIKARASGSDLAISVTDDGVGMDAAMLKQINEGSKKIKIGGKSHNSYRALYNIDRRLKLIFNDKYSLKAESRAGAGTTVIITIPIIYKESELTNT